MPIPTKLDTSRCVLFLGSGFTFGAVAIYGKSPPIGDGLKDRLADILKVDTKKYNFQTLANALMRRPNLNPYDTFTDMFRISSVNSDQKEILSRKWLRVYTTNYDDAAEVAMKQNGLDPKPFNYDDPKPLKTPRNSIIHLHGMIGKATEENVFEQLILTEKSYIRQYFGASSWYDEFRRDIKFCEALFFVGYSLQDPHITALIPVDEEIKSKTFFVIKDKPDELLTENLEDYGEIHAISTSGFAKVCRDLQPADKLKDINSLKCLKLVDAFKDQKGILPPTPNEVFDLIIFGKFNERRCLSNLPNHDYIVPRQSVAVRIVEAFEKNNTVLLHSDLGNGKTLLLWSIAHYLTGKGFTCFRCIASSPTIEAEIEAVAAVERLVILFDSYDVAVNCIDRFTQIIPQAKFIVCARTGLQQVRIHEIISKLPGPIYRHDANQITEEDRQDFIELLERFGIVKEDLKNRISNSVDVRNIVTVIYENKYVKDKIDQLLLPAMASKQSLATIGIILLFTWIGQPMSSSVCIEILELDPVQALAKHREAVADILEFEGDSVRAKSPIFAEYILQSQFDPDDLLLLVRRILIVAVSRKIERRYRSVLSSLMSFASLSRLLRPFTDAGDRIRKLYEELQRDNEIREEPLFWLQYTIAMIDNTRLDIAEGFMISAYNKADKNPSFETYQLDTQALRLSLMIEAGVHSGQPVRRIGNIIKYGKEVEKMIGNSNHRRFAVKVLENFRPFVQRRAPDLEAGDKSSIIDLFGGLIAALESLTAGARADTGADLASAELKWCLREMN